MGFRVIIISLINGSDDTEVKDVIINQTQKYVRLGATVKTIEIDETNPTSSELSACFDAHINQMNQNSLQHLDSIAKIVYPLMQLRSSRVLIDKLKQEIFLATEHQPVLKTSFTDKLDTMRENRVVFIGHGGVNSVGLRLTARVGSLLACCTVAQLYLGAVFGLYQNSFDARKINHVRFVHLSCFGAAPFSEIYRAGFDESVIGRIANSMIQIGTECAELVWPDLALLKYLVFTVKAYRIPFTCDLRGRRTTHVDSVTHLSSRADIDAAARMAVYARYQHNGLAYGPKSESYGFGWDSEEEL